MRAKSLVLVATGSSGAIVLPAYLAELRLRVRQEITVLLTATAERFVRPEVVGWFADDVITSDTSGVNPVEVALDAAAIVVLPASANTMASAALGLMPTPATTVLAASPAPCLFFPHMHQVVWRKPVMRGHVTSLRDAGNTVVDPVEAAGFEISRGATTVGLSMPGPDEAAAIVADWLPSVG